MKSASCILLILCLNLVVVGASQALTEQYVNLIENTEKWFSSEGYDKFVTLRMHTVVRDYAPGMSAMRREVLHDDLVLSSEDLLFEAADGGDILYHGKLGGGRFDEPILWVDAPLATGKTWTDSRPEIDGASGHRVHYVFAVLDESEVTCPAGSFACFRVFLSEIHPDGTILHSTFWYNQICGMVMCATENSRIFKLEKSFVRAEDGDGGYERHEDALGGALGLLVAPNPSNPVTDISFRLDRPAVVSVGIYDISGRLVQTLAAGERMGAGPVSLRWQGRDTSGRAVASGAYFFKVQAGNTVRTGRLSVIR